MSYPNAMRRLGCRCCWLLLCPEARVEQIHAKRRHCEGGCGASQCTLDTEGLDGEEDRYYEEIQGDTVDIPVKCHFEIRLSVISVVKENIYVVHSTSCLFVGDR